MEVVVGAEAPVHHPDDEHRVPLEPLGRVDGGEGQEPFVDVGGEHVAHAILRRLERHVGEERGQAPVARGNGDEVLQVLLPLGEVLAVDVAEHGRVESDHLRHLLARRHRVGGDRAEAGRQVAEVLRVGPTTRMRDQSLSRLLDRGRRRQMPHEILRRPRPEPLEQQEDPVPRDRVARVRDDAEVG